MPTARGQRMRLRRVSIGLAFGAVLLLNHGTASAGAPWKVSPLKAGKAVNPVAAGERAASAAEGKTIYTKECISCHGPTGKGDGTGAADLSKPATKLNDPEFAKQTDGDIFVKITMGRRPMPSYEKTLTEAQRWHVVNFLRTLTK